MSNNWNEKARWCFGNLGTGDKVGVNNAGIGIFKKKPYKGLAKEVLQNIIDAKDPDISGPVIARFEKIKVSKEDIPGCDRISEVIKRCYDYYHDGDDGIKMGLLKKATEDYLDSDVEIPVLKISDYNTVGLTGVTQEKGSNWTGLVREVSATNKGNGKSGSFGVGKFAPFNFSSIRTIIYTTLNKDKETALQGKTILTTFRDADNKLKQNVGLFGIDEEEDCKAIYSFDEVPETYRRSECGTDLFILAFKEEEGWMDQVAASVLEYFFYTIYKGELEVQIIDGERSISISKDNLGVLIEYYKNYCEDRGIEFSAPIYWEVLTDTTGKTKFFTEEFRGKGAVELYLLMDPESSERRILEMRAAGMKIQEDTAFRIGASFRGIFIATGAGSASDDPKDNINSFLRKCENQAHDAWSKDEYEDNRDEADKVIRAVHAWILEKIKSEMPEVEEDETEAYGLSDLLPNQNDPGDNDEEEKAFSSFEPLPIEIASMPNNPPKKKASDVSPAPQPVPEKEEIPVPDENGDEAMTGGGQEPVPNPPHPPYPGPFPGPFPGPDPVPNPVPDDDSGSKIPAEKEEKEGDKGKSSLKPIQIANVKTPYDVSRDMFRVSFVPTVSAEKVHIRIRIGADDDDKNDAEVITAFCGGRELVVRKEKGKCFIVVDQTTKDEKVVLSVKIANAKRCLLEVTAYA